jgi:hypothetical protein
MPRLPFKLAYFQQFGGTKKRRNIFILPSTFIARQTAKILEDASQDNIYAGSKYI